MFTSSSRVFLTALVLGALPAAGGDLTVTYNSTVNGVTTVVNDYYTPTKVRMSRAEHDTILETAAGRMVLIDHKKKEYSEITVAEVEAAATEINAKMEKARAQQEQAMKDMPPALREKLGKLAGGAFGALEVTKGSGSRRIAGYDAQLWIVSMGEMMRTEQWTTTALTLPVKPGELTRLQNLISPQTKNLGFKMDKLMQIEGVTLAVRTVIKPPIGKQVETTLEATEIKQSVPANAFDLPAGYKKTDSLFKALNR